MFPCFFCFSLLLLSIFVDLCGAFHLFCKVSSSRCASPWCRGGPGAGRPGHWVILRLAALFAAWLAALLAVLAVLACFVLLGLLALLLASCFACFASCFLLPPCFACFASCFLLPPCFASCFLLPPCFACFAFLLPCFACFASCFLLKNAPKPTSTDLTRVCAQYIFEQLTDLKATDSHTTFFLR